MTFTGVEMDARENLSSCLDLPLARNWAIPHVLAKPSPEGREGDFWPLPSNLFSHRDIRKPEVRPLVVSRMRSIECDCHAVV